MNKGADFFRNFIFESMRLCGLADLLCCLFCRCLGSGRNFCLEDVLFVDVAFAFAMTFFFAGAFLTAVLGLATLTEAFAEAVFELSFAVLEETFFAEGSWTLQNLLLVCSRLCWMKY